MFAVVPILAGLAVLATYGIGRRLAIRPPAGRRVAGRHQPDLARVVAGAADRCAGDGDVGAGVLPRARHGPRSAAAAGLSAALAILIRPNLVPLARPWRLLVPGAPRRPRPVLAASARLLRRRFRGCATLLGVCGRRGHQPAPVWVGHDFGLRPLEDQLALARVLPNLSAMSRGLSKRTRRWRCSGWRALLLPARRLWPHVADRRVFAVIGLFVLSSGPLSRISIRLVGIPALPAAELAVHHARSPRFSRGGRAAGTCRWSGHRRHRAWRVEPPRHRVEPASSNSARRRGTKRRSATWFGPARRRTASSSRWSGPAACATTAAASRCATTSWTEVARPGRRLADRPRRPRLRGARRASGGRVQGALSTPAHWHRLRSSVPRLRAGGHRAVRPLGAAGRGQPAEVISEAFPDAPGCDPPVPSLHSCCDERVQLRPSGSTPDSDAAPDLDSDCHPGRAQGCSAARASARDSAAAPGLAVGFDSFRTFNSRTAPPDRRRISVGIRAVVPGSNTDTGPSRRIA